MQSMRRRAVRHPHPPLDAAVHTIGNGLAVCR
jgi:hypothetical protein